MLDTTMTSFFTSSVLRRKIVLIMFWMAAFIVQLIPWHSHAQETQEPQKALEPQKEAQEPQQMPEPQQTLEPKKTQKIQENKNWLENAGTYLYVTKPTKFSTEVESWKDGKINDIGKLEVYVGDFPKDRHSGSPKILLRFTEDGIRKGRLILYESERAWMYFRGTNQAIRIPTAEQLIGDADVASVLNLDLREIYSIKDIKIVDDDESSPKSVIELTDKTGSSPYASVMLTLDAKTSRPIDAKFYSLSGKLVRTVEYVAFQPFQGKHVLQTVKITAHLNAKSDYTLLKYVAVKPYELPRRFFVPALLKDL